MYTKLGEMTDADKATIHTNILGSIRQTFGSGSGSIRKSRFEFRITFGGHFGLGGVCAL